MSVNDHLLYTSSNRLEGFSGHQERHSGVSLLSQRAGHQQPGRTYVVHLAVLRCFISRIVVEQRPKLFIYVSMKQLSLNSAFYELILGRRCNTPSIHECGRSSAIPTSCCRFHLYAPIRYVLVTAVCMTPDSSKARDPPTLHLRMLRYRAYHTDPGCIDKAVGLRPHWSRSNCTTGFVKDMVFMLIPAPAQHFACIVSTP
jgi:hypothetical protein